MANQYSNEGSGPSNISEETSDSTVEINVKTLESQIYSFQVDKNMIVSLFKEKIADQTGVPVGQQRLIFRGKVLKDDHPLSEYHLENGHTLHLVVRQPSQPQSSSGTSSAEPHTNTGNDGSGAPRARVGQISHSVVLGTFNVGDQGEAVAPDLSRVIGAVLNSIGLGNQAATNVTSNIQTTMPNNPGQSPQGNETGGSHGNATSQGQGGNNAESGQTFSSQPFQTLPQFLQTPFAAGASPFPSLNTSIPDALNTLIVFMNRMEQALSQNGVYQQNISATNPGDLPRVNLPSNAQGLPTPEALGIVLRNAERLLSSHAASALSHIAGRLEQEGASADPDARGQIQTESAQVGLAMQHLGALLLELGRTIWTLRMGQSPGEAVVNAGPAVYISPSGPNPIMVQPIPYQTSSPFGASVPLSNPMNFGPVGVGSAPRNVNIHIHAGTSLSALAARGSNGEGMQAENRDGTGSRDSGAARVLPVRNVIATTLPSSQTGTAISSASLPGSGASVPRPPSDSSLSSIMAELSSQIRNVVGNIQGNDVVQSGQAVPHGQNSSTGIGSRNNTGDEQLSNSDVNGDQQSNASLLPGCTSESEVQKASESVPSLRDDSKFQTRDSLSSRQHPMPSGDDKGNASQSAAKQDMTEGVKAVPLGLGLGMLERKKVGRQQKTPQKKSDSGTSSSSNQNQQVTSGQQLLQSLATRSTAGSRLSTSDTPARQAAPTVGQVRDGRSLGVQGPGGQVDMGTVMSQVLQSPALNGLLSGVSEQTGVGSPDALRNMLQNFTQSPQMMNAVNQITEQVDTQDVGNLFAGLGGGQVGGIDMSRMFQQMMPIVSRALGAGSSPAQPLPVMGTESHSLYNERNLTRDDNEIDLQQVVQRIEQLNAPEHVFQAVVENSVQLSARGSSPQELVDELCSDEGLSTEYAEILRRDIRRRLEGASRQDKC
ncbi:ubiquitin-like domain-containing protein CIP73 isoform X4 [Argentina anserina]|uniref:ubiquitin-like domain-containing protein CIP73 isoform X1 n=1 Tax=Argentina anserina TaxID=57926 RepID=UPI00217631A3|nr:ubiquitin-like domain-containing protein CIP73 isoform X1 [Potentilla anserina]XP_050366933.1 ubiquitin-like domain-containing protein CIP73 isoform X2 [Potentilla anserina]XP_050366935.1 ubiquitin-like domain-containing protein CIP73 isoform X3 [Potentilla anserina]XP_050366936.1 ubiquitin-like domain-containing protein CIP73 isoform X4 [Potentilla anserina]